MIVLVALGVLAQGPHALGQDAPDAGAPVETLPDLPLPEIPKLPPPDASDPTPEAAEELDALLGRLTSDDERGRELAAAEVGKASPGVVAAIRRRVQPIRESLDRKVAPILLDNARAAARKKRKKGGDAKAGDDESEDWLAFMLEEPKPRDVTWRDVVHLLAMVRLLSAVGDTPACRELIQLRSYFGDLLRIDLERQLVALKDRAVPALIEARKHDAPVVARWAERLLDRMGRAIPGEAVASNDAAVLADVMRAFGRTRDVDAARVVLTFANAERRELREAARAAIGAIGEPGKWQLREVYLGLTGDKPPREWSWDRIAQEIFRIYDQRRLAEVYRLMDEGLAATKGGDLAAATQAFDRILARDPLFERRKDMVPAYVGRAKEVEATDLDAALELLRKALRLDASNPEGPKLESEIAYLEAKQLIDRGAPDRFLLERALELDPDNTRAAEALAGLEQRTMPRKESTRRYFYAGGVLFLAALAMIFLVRRRKPLLPPPAIPPGSPSRSEGGGG